MFGSDLGLSRRSFLRGTGALVALPYLESLVGAAGVSKSAAKVKPPVRMGIFTVTGGTVKESWVPTETGALGKLPSILRPLEAVKSELLVLSGLSHSGKSEGLNAHQACAYMHLTGADKVSAEHGKPVTLVVSDDKTTRVAESVDQRAARLMKDKALLSSMEIGYTEGETLYSYRANGSNVAFEKDPRYIFERMFKGRTPIAPNWERRLAALAEKPRDLKVADTYDKQVVDLVLADAKRLNKRLGAGDKHKLGEYLAAIESVEQRISHIQNRLAIEALDLADPGPSHIDLPRNLPKDAAAANKLIQIIGRNPAVHGEYIKLIGDLMVLAFQTDTTRVCTMGVGSDGALFPGVVTVGYEYHMHTLEHQGNAARVEDADPISREGCRQVHAWYTQLFAHVVERMRNIDEGGSSLLDNSMLLYTSYMADGGHGTKDYPVLLAGRAGGTLNTGRHIAYQKDTPVANLYAEMLKRMGDASGEFGNNKTSPKRAYDGLLPDLI